MADLRKIVLEDDPQLHQPSVAVSAEHIQKPLPSTMRPMKLSESLL